MGGGRYALLVATSDYHDEGLRALRAPADDAGRLAEVLADAQIGGFTVDVLTDPLVQDLRVRIDDFFADRAPDDLLLLHFACHGVKDEAGRLFLTAHDTTRTRLTSTAVPADEVGRLMLRSRAQRAVLMLDCCFAGAIERGMVNRAGSDADVMGSLPGLDERGSARGRAVFTASNAIEYAFEGSRILTDSEPGGPSLFTDAVVRALASGEADRNDDGFIGLSELADYVRDRMRESSSNQTPQLWMFGAQGDLTIARARLRRPAPTPLPASLAAAVVAASPEKRLWGVNDLADLLTGDDVGLAMSAHTALTELSRDDSRRVASAAALVLTMATLEAGRTSVHFGTGPTGSERTVVIPISGPPVARHTVTVQSPAWLEVSRDPDQITLTIGADHQDSLDGVVRIQSLVGQVDVDVTAEPAGCPEDDEVHPPGKGLSVTVPTYVFPLVVFAAVAILVLLASTNGWFRIVTITGGQPSRGSVPGTTTTLAAEPLGLYVADGEGIQTDGSVSLAGGQAVAGDMLLDAGNTEFDVLAAADSRPEPSLLTGTLTLTGNCAAFTTLDVVTITVVVKGQDNILTESINADSSLVLPSGLPAVTEPTRISVNIAQTVGPKCSYQVKWANPALVPAGKT